MKILVAGIGNIFLGDDGFGPAVAQQLATRAWPAHVEVADFGIRGIDLAFALTSGFDAAILVDAIARGGPPGTLYALEPAAGAPPMLEGHSIDPARAVAFAATLGPLPAVRIVGCEPEDLEGDALSPAVAAAVAPAADMVAELVAALEAGCTS